MVIIIIIRLNGDANSCAGCSTTEFQCGTPGIRSHTFYSTFPYFYFYHWVVLLCALVCAAKHSWANFLPSLASPHPAFRLFYLLMIAK